MLFVTSAIREIPCVTPAPHTEKFRNSCVRGGHTPKLWIRNLSAGSHTENAVSASRTLGICEVILCVSRPHTHTHALHIHRHTHTIHTYTRHAHTHTTHTHNTHNTHTHNTYTHTQFIHTTHTQHAHTHTTHTRNTHTQHTHRHNTHTYTHTNQTTYKRRVCMSLGRVSVLCECVRVVCVLCV